MSGDATRRGAAWTAIAAGTLIRLALAVSQPEIADTPNFHKVAEALRDGHTLYVDTRGWFPYPPVWNRVEVAALFLTEKTATPFAFWIKVPSILGDAAIAALLLFLAPPGRGALLAAAYALNPVPILITGAHGQFDALAILGCLGALFLTQRGRGPVLAGLALGAGIALKSFPVLLLPVFWPCFDARGRWKFVSAALLPVGLFLLTYLVFVPAAVVREVFGYSGACDHGWAAIVRSASVLRTGALPANADLAGLLGFAKLLFLAAFGFEIWHWSRRPESVPELPKRIAIVFVLFYVVYGGIGSQCLLWAIPFLLLVAPTAGLAYSAAAICTLVPFYRLFYSGLLFVDPPIAPEDLRSRFQLWLAGTAIWWLFCLAWLIRAAVLPDPKAARAVARAS